MNPSSICLFVTLSLGYAAADAQVKTLVSGRMIESPMAEGERHTYRLALAAGQFVHVTVEQIGIDVVITVLDPNGVKVDEVDSPTGTQGIENVVIEAEASGTYQLEIYPLEDETYQDVPAKGKYKVWIKEMLSAADYATRLKDESTRHLATIQWIKENAIRLRGVEAEQGFDDMRPLKQIIGSARLVALGEATHGTREFFQLKHRMLEYLATEEGFTIFGIEATMPEGFDVNEYVLTGKGDPEKALAGLYFWTWNTEEVLGMIRWMRRYNADPSHPKKLKFYGFDMQSGSRAFKVLENYLNQVDHKAADALRKNARLALLKNAHSEREFGNASGEELRSALNVLAAMIEHLDTNKAEYVARTGEDQWEIARLHGLILSQYVRSNTDFVKGSAVRDSSMAANVRWIMEREGTDARMVIWAHNYHVSRDTSGGVASMGYHLRKTYGNNLVIFGFVFHQGSFQAIEMPFWAGSGLRPFHVKPLPEGSLDATLGATGLTCAAVDLRRLPDGYVTEWFAKPHLTRSFGSEFSLQSTSSFAAPAHVTALYDALLFVDETNAARPNPGGTVPPIRRLTSPENPDFESGEPGLIPEGWNANKYRLASFDFRVETSREHPQKGRNCAKISRESGKHYGETSGSLSQRLNATPYRGRRIRLGAAVRTKVEGPGNHAYLWLRAAKQGYGPSSMLFEDNMTDRPITTSEWRFFEINGEVPAEAQWIDFGMTLSGEGSAWFDSFSLELVEPQQVEER